MSERSHIVKEKDQGSPLVARIVLVTILLTMFAVYMADIYYR